MDSVAASTFVSRAGQPIYIREGQKQKIILFMIGDDGEGGGRALRGFKKYCFYYNKKGVSHLQ